MIDESGNQKAKNGIQTDMNQLVSAFKELRKGVARRSGQNQQKYYPKTQRQPVPH